jgi:hypothetical protein
MVRQGIAAFREGFTASIYLAADLIKAIVRAVSSFSNQDIADAKK